MCKPAGMGTNETFSLFQVLWTYEQIKTFLILILFY